jgi:hypothetical protein
MQCQALDVPGDFVKDGIHSRLTRPSHIALVARSQEAHASLHFSLKQDTHSLQSATFAVKGRETWALQVGLLNMLRKSSRKPRNASFTATLQVATLSLQNA